MSDIKSFISSYLLEPFKEYSTDAQEAIIKLIIDKLYELYAYTLKFPEIVSPNQYRLDIVRTIANQFLFAIRDEADLYEQLEILNKILYVYTRRGSIDTIENMWKYYGGNLPKDVKVKIPSYNLFRYSVSALSGTHTFQDNETNRTGVYEVSLTNNYYSTAELRKFLIKELVAAGNYIYITNNFLVDLTGDSSQFPYTIREDNLISIFMSSYCTPSSDVVYILRYLYNRQGEIVEKEYPGYFVLKSTLLGEEVI